MEEATQITELQREREDTEMNKIKIKNDFLGRQTEHSHPHCLCWRAGNACLELLWEHLEPGNELLAQKMQDEELLKQLSKEQNCSGERRVWERRRRKQGHSCPQGWECRGKDRRVIHEQKDVH